MIVISSENTIQMKKGSKEKEESVVWNSSWLNQLGHIKAQKKADAQTEARKWWVGIADGTWHEN